MATKWTTPGITFREVDNSIRNNATVGDGRGAIVLNANQGYVNQRVLSTTLDDFYKTYGEPDNVNQYGHFAAANFFAAGSQQLLAVRATMGDEGYAYIQYPYTDAVSVDVNTVSGIQTFRYVDNELEDGVSLVTTIDGTTSSVLKKTGYTKNNDEDANDKFVYLASAERAELKDIFDVVNGKDTSNVYVYRSESASSTEYASGTFFHFSNETTGTTEYSIALKGNDIPLVEYTSGTVSEMNATSSAYYYSNDNGYSIFVPSTVTLNGEYQWLSDLELSDNFSAVSANGLVSVLKDCISKEQEMEYNDEAASRLVIFDWDDSITKTFVVLTDDDYSYSNTHSNVYGIKYKEYGKADVTNDLAMADLEAECYIFKKCSEYTSDAEYSKLVEIADEYGLDVSDIATDDYGILTYVEAKTGDTIIVLVKKINQNESNVDAFVETYVYLFAVYKGYKDTDVTLVSVIEYTDPESVVKPWQVSTDGSTKAVSVNKMIAMSTTEIMADTTGLYADGYTASCLTDDEPGNGDIESYVSNQENQLVIAAIGPGKFGNNIGISIITPEAVNYSCLSNVNAFDWKYKYDDEDKVDNATAPDDYTQNDEDLTWKKVYRINVYVKPTEKTTDYFGHGLDALTTSPIESWYVSNDPTVVDGDGNSLYAPYVINGKSNYIYVSKSSVEDSSNTNGGYSMPKMTWSVYALEGGTNSSLNNIKEKTAALKLYSDRQKSDFDILFNVEAIDSFTTKQRYRAHQNRIAEIASSRGMDIGVIQATSREAKTIKLELSEAKSFSFSNGSYVAAYAGYDRYYDSYTANYVYLPKSVAGACAMCYCDIYSYPWLAPAGLARGSISYSDRSNINHNDDEIGQLYSNNINTSKETRSYGEILWGQKTMLKKESALNRINVRRLLNYIEKNLETMLVPYLFQNNTTNTRTSMETTVNAFLSRIQSADGIISKSVSIKTDPDDSHIVYVDIELIPAESIEWICVTLTVNPNTGVSSSES